MGLGLDERFFEGERAGDSYWCMRVIHYPPLAAVSASASASLPVDGEIERSVQLSCGEHTDYGARIAVVSMRHRERGYLHAS
jgi:isopenicillin N synthase-like dioxygenase